LAFNLAANELLPSSLSPTDSAEATGCDCDGLDAIDSLRWIG
jgi:hypothetical protein